MKKVLFLTSALMIGALGMAACESAPNVNTGTTRNAVANAANAVANAVSNTAAKITVDSPEDFLRTAGQSGMHEVEMSKLAATKGKNPELKKLAQMLVTHHEAVNTELKALAGKKNVTLPTPTDSHVADMEKMKKETGEQFDSNYVKAMLDGHQSSVSAFQKQADGSADAEVKAFAAKVLPTLKSHLESFKSLQLKMQSSAKMDE